jgi:hypothetical protein
MAKTKTNEQILRESAIAKIIAATNCTEAELRALGLTADGN